MIKRKQYKAIVVGVSAGGFDALKILLSKLPGDFPLSILIVQHLHPIQDGFYIKYFSEMCNLRVKEAEGKENIQSGTIYFAPPNYHLLVEEDRSISLSNEEKVNYSRPSIDVLFESASDVYLSELIGLILTGANDDGAKGIRIIKENGGLTIAQDPATAKYPIMPQSAIDKVGVDYVLPLEDISKKLVELTRN
jgi:two-component system chemotaxis response regulator CheB